MKNIPKRRWLRFSVRTLLLLTVVVACWLGVQVNQAQKRRAAITAVREAGGFCFLEHDSDWKRSLNASIGEEYRTKPLVVGIRAAAIDDALLMHLRNMPRDSELALDRREDVERFSELLPAMHVYAIDH